MKKQIIFVIFLILAGCGAGDKSENANTNIVVKINNFELLEEDFNDLIKLEAETNPNFEVTDQGCRKFLDYLIRKEILIQTAKSQKLDRKQNFLQTIERYWESTLIRDLIEQKNHDLRRNVLITSEEVKAYFDAHRENFVQPFEKVKKRIHKRLESKKVSEKVEKWVQKLIESADIQISESVKKLRT